MKLFKSRKMGAPGEGGGNMGCNTPNEHPPMIGHYIGPLSPTFSHRSRHIRAPCRIPDDKSQSTVSTIPKIPVWNPKASPIANADLPPRPATPPKLKTSYQRDYEIVKTEDIADDVSVISERKWKQDKYEKSQSDDRSQISQISYHLELGLGSMRSGRSGHSVPGGAGGEATPRGSEKISLTARALENLESIEEERERAEKETRAQGSPREAKAVLLFGSPRGRILNPQTGKPGHSKHQHVL